MIQGTPPRFSEWMDAIDTNRKIPVTVVAVFTTSCMILYLVRPWESKEYYIVDDEMLIEYDKYWEGWED